MKVALIDNYDSFTYNLYDYLCRLGTDCDVYRNDKIELEILSNYDAIVLSPGPKRPADAGLLMEIIEHYYLLKPILGICLGHQALGEYFGAKLLKADIPVHGKTSQINHSSVSIFENIENPMQVMRYHSLILKDLPECLVPIAESTKNEIMAFRHISLPIWGVQFHPESILTTHGMKLLGNWIKIINN
jgi:anthranilate synthase/aminodeoxychorismate synthase-like glutamine amidotransferase